MSSGFPTRPDTNRPAQSQKLASLEISAIESRDIVLFQQQTTKVLIRLRGCIRGSIFSWPSSFIRQLVRASGRFGYENSFPTRPPCVCFGVLFVCIYCVILLSKNNLHFVFLPFDELFIFYPALIVVLPGYLHKMSLITRKPVFGVCDQIRLKPACSAQEAS